LRIPSLTILKVGASIMQSKFLSIPEAIDVERNIYIKAHEADSHAPKGRYICRNTNCNKPVKRILRGNTCFFRHYPDESSISHSKSQDLHKRAIDEIRNQFINVQKYGLTMPIFQLSTKQGLKEIVPFLPNFTVKTEWPLGKRFIDVAILDAYDNPILLIEVLNTHKICQEKVADIDQYPWVEIKVKSILSSQRILKIERHHRFPQEYDNFFQLDLLLH